MGLHLENTLGCTHPTVPLFPSQQCVCERERQKDRVCVCVSSDLYLGMSGC